jgi:hypothetical protein
MPKRTRLPTGHRQLVNLLLKGGLIQEDDSGIAWVSASRSNGHFTHAVVERIKARGFYQDRQHFAVVESNHPGKWWALVDGPPRPRRKKKEVAA